MKDMVVDYFLTGFRATKSYYRILVKQQKEYKINAFMKFLGFPARLFVIIFLWSILSQGSDIPFEYFILYYIGVFALNLMYPYVRVANRVVAQDILRGHLSKYLVRGIPYWSTRFGDWLATIQWFIITVIPIYMIIVFFTLDDITISHLIGFVYLFFTGSILTLTFWIIAGMSAFIFEDAQGPLRFFGILLEFASGSLLPLFLLPTLFVNILSYLPFQYIVFIPIQVLLGEISLNIIFVHCLISSFWLIVMLLLAYFIWHYSLKRYISSFV